MLVMVDEDGDANVDGRWSYAKASSSCVVESLISFRGRRSVNFVVYTRCLSSVFAFPFVSLAVCPAEEAKAGV